jgi:hypothetical protein
MAVTWNVVSLDATKTVGSLSDVVTTVHWTASDKDGDHSGSTYGSIGLAAADSSSFTPYKDIKETDAIAWAKAAIGSDEVTKIEASIATQIKESKTPTVTAGVPW